MKRGIVALIRKNNKTLLISKKDGFRTVWQFPTCEVVESEEPEAAGLQKIGQKFGLDLELKDFIDLIILPNSTIYFYEFYPKSDDPILPKEFKDFSWVEKTKLEDFLSKQAIDAMPNQVISLLKF